MGCVCPGLIGGSWFFDASGNMITRESERDQASSSHFIQYQSVAIIFAINIFRSISATAHYPNNTGTSKEQKHRPCRYYTRRHHEASTFLQMNTLILRSSFHFISAVSCVSALQSLAYLFDSILGAEPQGRRRHHVVYYGHREDRGGGRD